MSEPEDPAASTRSVRKLPYAYLTPGTLYCSAEPAVVGTVLGSCVAVCLVDRHHRAGGMNHYVLPHASDGEDSLRYGDTAIERLCERMERFGCRPPDLRAKVFGGAAVLPFGELGETVGTKNVQMAIDWLRERGIPVVARRTGGKNGLLVRFFTGSGRVLVRTVSSTVEIGPDGTIPVFDSRLTQAV